MIYDHIVCFLEMVSLKSVCFPCPLCADTCYAWQRVWYCGRPSHGGERLKTVQVQVSYYQSSWPVLSQQDERHEREAVEGLNTRRFACIFTVICEWQCLRHFGPDRPPLFFQSNPSLCMELSGNSWNVWLFPFLKSFYFHQRKTSRYIESVALMAVWFYGDI